VLDAQSTGSVVTVPAGAGATLGGLRIVGGNAENGGGVRNGGTVAIVGSMIYANAATSEGGGIYNIGTLLVGDSTIKANQAGLIGGGISDRGRSNLARDTVAANFVLGARGGAGGIYVMFGSTMDDVTVSGNQALGAGGWAGGVYGGEWSAIHGAHLTVTGNQAADTGGVLTAGGVSVDASIVARNTGGDCGGSLGGRYDLDGDGTCLAAAGTGGSSGKDPKLAPLAANGGPTQTQAIPPASPAYGAIPVANALCDGIDQRGVTRRSPVAAGCDIGAYQAPPPPKAALGTTSLAFGSQAIASRRTSEVTVTNVGGFPLSVTPTLTGSARFAMTTTCRSGSAPVPVAPGRTCAVAVTFAPTGTGAVTASLRVVDAAGAAATVAISGTGVVARPANLTAPTVSGTPRLGRTLTASPGTWSGGGTITYRYQWLRMDSTDHVVDVIPGATAATYRPTTPDVTNYVFVRVTASNAAGTGGAADSASVLIGP